MQVLKDDKAIPFVLEQGSPAFLRPRIPSAFLQMRTYP